MSTTQRKGRGWLAAGLVVAILLIGGGAWNVASALSHEPIHRHHVWSGVTAVDIHAGNGSITVVGADQAEVTVSASGSRGLSSPTDHESLKEGTLTIRSGCGITIGNNWCSLSYRLTVPRGITVSADSGDSSVTAQGVRGHLSLSSGNGNVRAEGPAGTLSLHSGNGDVRVVGATSAHVTATSGNGSVNLGFAQPPTDVTAHSGNGNVTVGLPDTTDAYQVSVHSGNGSTSTRVRTDPTSSRQVTASSGNGNVTLRYGPG
ncbi:MAG: DUF4097 family beta strand repeat protein [Acidimicrobiaceae bacterium]|nr:DUF4097 family beta strand repeat protein [Acidimicrobiaceae bacterium]